MHLYLRLYPYLFLILASLVTATSSTDLHLRDNAMASTSGQVKIVANVPVAPPDQPRIEFLKQPEKASVSNPKVLPFFNLPECAFPSPEHVLEVLRFIQDSTDDILVIQNGGTDDRRAQKVEQIWKVFQALDHCLRSKSVENLSTSIQQKKVFQHSSDMDTTLQQFNKVIEHLVKHKARLTNDKMINEEELAKVISILIHGQDQECDGCLENLAFKALGDALSTEQSKEMKDLLSRSCPCGHRLCEKCNLDWLKINSDLDSDILRQCVYCSREKYLLKEFCKMQKALHLRDADATNTGGDIILTAGCHADRHDISRWIIPHANPHRVQLFTFKVGGFKARYNVILRRTMPQTVVYKALEVLVVEDEFVNQVTFHSKVVILRRRLEIFSCFTGLL